MNDRMDAPASPDPGPGPVPRAGKTGTSKPMPVWALGFILIPVVFLLIGAVNLYLDYDVMRRYVETEGTVSGGRIEKKRSTSGSGRQRRTSTTYRPIIDYTYAVNGKQYSGSGYDRAGVSSSSHRSAQKVLDRFPKGSTCKVYHDPDAPAKSVLVKRLSVLFIIFTIVGAVLTVVLGFALPYAYFKSRLEAEPD